MNAGSKYAFELYAPNGTLVADLTGRARSRTFTRSRNEADDISFELDFNEFHAYCEDISMHPRALLVPGQTELRVKRYNKYLAGGQITYAEPDISAQSQVMSVRASGFLNLFADRDIPFTEYLAVDVAAMVWDAIDTSQSAPNGDFGITLGSLPTIALSNQTPNRVAIKDFLQQLASSPTKGFDFDFTPDKVFNVYTQIGSTKRSVIFEFPVNIKSFNVPLDATRIANEVIALGAGIGEDAASEATVDNAISQTTYKLRQKIITFNGADDTYGTVTDVADAELTAWGVPLEVPALLIDGNKEPFVGSYDIGDYVWVKLGAYKWFESFNGFHRIEKYTVDIDDDDNEEVKLYLQS